MLRESAAPKGTRILSASYETLGERHLCCDGDPALLFTENETKNARLFETANHTPHVKDGINDFVVHQKQDAVNPARTGTKAAADYQLTVGPGETRVIKLRLGDAAPGKSGTGLGKDFDEIFAARLHEADEFYASVAPATIGEDRSRILRQAHAGMLWTKQFYSFEADTWFEQHHSHPLLGQTGRTRNQDWYHMVNDDVISMPDKWED